MRVVIKEWYAFFQWSLSLPSIKLLRNKKKSYKKLFQGIDALYSTIKLHLKYKNTIIKQQILINPPFLTSSKKLQHIKTARSQWSQTFMINRALQRALQLSKLQQWRQVTQTDLIILQLGSDKLCRQLAEANQRKCLVY